MRGSLIPETTISNNNENLTKHERLRQQQTTRRVLMETVGASITPPSNLRFQPPEGFCRLLQLLLNGKKAQAHYLTKQITMPKGVQMTYSNQKQSNRIQAVTLQRFTYLCITGHLESTLTLNWRH